MFPVFLEISTFVGPSVPSSGQWMGYVLYRELVIGFRVLKPEKHLK